MNRRLTFYSAVTITPLIIGIVIIGVFSSNGISRLKSTPVARNGVIDLSHWDFDVNGNVALDGEWEMYWEQLVSPERFASDVAIDEKVLGNVPRVWTFQSIESKPLPHNGYATYRLKIVKDPSVVQMGIRILKINSAYKLWVDGWLIATSGELSTQPGTGKAMLEPTIVMFRNSASTMDLVIQVSENGWARGGIPNSILLGTSSGIGHNWIIRTVIEVVTAVIILIMASFYVGLFLFTHKDNIAIYFGVFCFFAAVFILLSGVSFAGTIFPILRRYDLNTAISLSCVFLSIPAYFTYTNRLFGKVVKSRLELYFKGFGIAVTLFYWLTPGFISWRIVLPYLILTTLILIYGLFKTLRKTALENQIENILALSGSVIYISILIAVILGNWISASIGMFINVGLLILVTIHTVDQMKRFGTALDHAQNLSEENQKITTELQAYNTRLEEQVRERTREITNSLKRAEQANNAKTTFLSNISHELRTPMQGILGFSNLGMIKVGELSADKIRTYFTEIKESGTRLLTLLDDLLDLSRLESGKEKYNIDQTNINSLVSYAQKEIQTLLVSKGMTVTVISDNDPIFIQADPIKIIQVIINLLSNAIKYSPKETGIQIRITDKDTMIQVSIQDEGVGIPDDEKISIFDTFSQSSKTSTGAGGTGLGLAICKKIITDHHGKIWAENNEQTGCTLSFSLPKLNSPSQTDTAEN